MQQDIAMFIIMCFFLWQVSSYNMKLFRSLMFVVLNKHSSALEKSLWTWKSVHKEFSAIYFNGMTLSIDKDI